MSFVKKELEYFIGKGITLPLKLVDGAVPLETGFDLIRASIKTILSWPINTRFFLPEFGSLVEELLEEPNDDVLQATVETFVVEAINNWEKRVEVEKVSIFRTEFTLGERLEVEITYRVIATERTDTFIHPFYTQIIH